MMPNSAKYTDKLKEFIFRNGVSEDASPVEIFHAVRNIPYQSRGERDPEVVLAKNEGSCSGKHILLRDLLRHINQIASIETVQGDFAATLPLIESMPPELQHYSRAGGVKDFHHYVVWQGPDGECKLDATWPDCITALGFPGNSDWTGEGDTKVALKPEVILERVEDIVAYKRELLDELTEDEKNNRLRFLLLLSDWLAGIQAGGGAQ